MCAQAHSAQINSNGLRDLVNDHIPIIKEIEVSGNRNISGLILDAGCLFSGNHVHLAAGMFPPVTVRSSLPAPDGLGKPTCPAQTTQGSVPQQNKKHTIMLMTILYLSTFADYSLVIVFHKTTV